jgi:predicted transcriptional regulator
MTKNVAYVNPDSTVVETEADAKAQCGFHSVCDQTGVIGIVTDRYRRQKYSPWKRPKQTPGQRCYDGTGHTVTPDADMPRSPKMMATNKVADLPVVDNNMLVGIVALGDVATMPGFTMEVSDTRAEDIQPLQC